MLIAIEEASGHPGFAPRNIVYFRDHTGFQETGAVESYFSLTTHSTTTVQPRTVMLVLYRVVILVIELKKSSSSGFYSL
jgi:hypothetical protein